MNRKIPSCPINEAPSTNFIKQFRRLRSLIEEKYTPKPDGFSLKLSLDTSTQCVYNYNGEDYPPDDTELFCQCIIDNFPKTWDDTEPYDCTKYFEKKPYSSYRRSRRRKSGTQQLDDWEGSAGPVGPWPKPWSGL